MKKFYLIILLFAINKIYAQTTPSMPAAGVEITKAIPASPDAAALGKYGSIPVSPYTGVPNISIPIYTIKSGSISLPISLSYHAGGNKVEEMSSSVGLGWALNAGGVIVRTIRGLPDEAINGYLDANCRCVPNLLATINGGTNLSSQSVNEYFNEIADGTMDGEADMYNFNFGSYSGRFVMDSYGNITTIPNQKIKFSFVINTATPMITSFTAVTPDGLTYVFGGIVATETTDSESSCGVQTQKGKFFSTSWFLTQITDPTGHQVNFNYTAESYSIPQNRSDTRYQFYATTNNNAAIPSMPEQLCTATSLVRGVKISSINFENGVCNFHVSPRNDVGGANLIDSISVTGVGFEKNYRMYYTNNTTSRLRLDSLIGYLPTTATNKKNETYHFNYSSDPWTSYTKFCQDYWGYNNGTNSTTEVPTMTFTPSGSSIPVTVPGADRGTNASTVTGGMLTSITYPTGGYTTFNFEPNTDYNMDFGGTYSTPPVNHQIAKCNDPANTLLYNYDINHGNALDTMTLVSNSGSYLGVTIIASGLASSGSINNNDLVANLKLIDANGNIVPGYNTPIKNTDTIVYLSPGRYQILLTDGKNDAYPTGTVKYAIQVNWQTTGSPLNYQNYIVGGARVQQISDYDGKNPAPINQKTFSYTLPGTTYSSGWIDFQPVYSYYLGVNSGSIYAGLTTSTFLTETSVSNYPLATTQGSVVGYSHVTEFDGLNGQNGKIDYFYVNAQSAPDINSQIPINTSVGFTTNNGFPFSPWENIDWERGLLIRQTTYRSAGNSVYAKVQDKTYGYSVLNGSYNDNIKAGFDIKAASYGETNTYYSGYPDGRIEIGEYTDYTNFTYLSSETTTDYDLNDTTMYVQTTNNYQMDTTNFLVSNITSTNSKNEKIIQNVTYPSDYNANSGTGSSMLGLAYLKSKNILSYPVEEITQKSNADGSNLRTIKAVLTTYKPTHPFRDSVYEMRSVMPVTGFVNSSAGAVNILKDSHYQPVVDFQNYDSFGNILQENKIYGPIQSYIWAYPDGSGINTCPVAQISNADINNIAYSNFESSSSGNWNYNAAGIGYDPTAPMGANCYQLATGGAISESSLVSGTTYTVSFWSKSGSAVTVTGGTVTAKPAGITLNGWTYYEYQIAGATSLSIAGSGSIDELRLYPVTAQMSTYTYIPLVGISSACNSKSQLTYYYYDSLGRLTDIKDQYGNIVKHMTYHYQGQ